MTGALRKIGAACRVEPLRWPQMEWSEIALPVGSPPGDLGMHLNFKLPAAVSESAASERQVEAVRFFYQTDFDDLRRCQARAFLSCREYSRLCAEAIFKRFPASVRQMMARALAAYVLADPETTDFVIRWNDRNFERGTGSPRVRGTPFFADVEKFADYLDGMLEMNGWTESHLKRLRP